jgi:hypothetical protein
MKMLRKKYIIPSLVILALLFSACDKTEISSRQADTFIRYYGVGLEDEGTKVITTEEGYLIMANVHNPGRGEDICIIRTDEYGNSTAPLQMIGGAFNDVGYAIKPGNGGYIIAGSTQLSQDADREIYIVKLSANGDFEWAHQPFPYAYDNEAYDVLVEDDGNLILTGYTALDESSQNIDMFYAKTDATATTNIRFTANGIPQADEVARSLVLWRDSTYIFSGYSIGTLGIREIFLLRWDGQFRGGKPLTIHTERPSEAVCIINTSEDSKFLVGCNYERSAGKTDILLLEVDTTLLERNITSKYLGERDNNFIMDMSLQGNSIYLAGTAASGESNHGDILFIRLTEFDSDPQYYYIGDGISNIGNGFDITKDNGYVFTGASFLNEKSSISLIKVDNEGNF